VSDFLKQVFEEARSATPPEAARKFRVAGVRLLATFCRELQRAAEDVGQGTFYLSCRDAGQLLGVVPDTASRWLSLLQGAQVIACVVKGSKKSGLASQYRYLGD
jgi:hypothetical protein